MSSSSFKEVSGVTGVDVRPTAPYTFPELFLVLNLIIIIHNVFWRVLTESIP